MADSSERQARGRRAVRLGSERELEDELGPSPVPLELLLGLAVDPERIHGALFARERSDLSIDELARQVHSLQYEVSRLREKLGPQPEWMLFIGFSAFMILAVGLILVAATKKAREPSPESPRIEAQSALPEKSS